MNSPDRTDAFRRNQDLESLLREINSRLARGEEGIEDQFPAPQKPVVLVIGPPRSGTTLMTQWLADTGLFAVPTNLLSRFYGAPYIGGLIQQLLFDDRFNYKNELRYGTTDATAYRSDLGKTQGPLEPSEFWYFWRRFFPLPEARPLTEEEMNEVDPVGFRQGLASIEAVFGKPIAMKGILLQYNLAILDAALPKVLFLQMRRSTLPNAYSIYRARERYFGDSSKWFSVRPPGCEEFENASAATQVVAQVALTRSSIASQLSSIAPERQITVDYERFCDDPKTTFQELADRFQRQGCDLAESYSGPAHFDNQNDDRRMSPDLREELNAALQALAIVGDSEQMLEKP